MCGCEQHHDRSKPCTCICPEHRNFNRAYDLAMSRYDEIVELRRRVAQLQRDYDTVADERHDLRRAAAAAEQRITEVEPPADAHEWASTHRIISATAEGDIVERAATWYDAPTTWGDALGYVRAALARPTTEATRPAPCVGCSKDGRPGQHVRDCAWLAWLGTVIIDAGPTDGGVA